MVFLEVSQIFSDIFVTAGHKTSLSPSKTSCSLRFYPKPVLKGCHYPSQLCIQHVCMVMYTSIYVHPCSEMILMEEMKVNLCTLSKNGCTASSPGFFFFPSFSPSLSSLKAPSGSSCRIIVLQSVCGRCALSTTRFSGMWIPPS